MNKEVHYEGWLIKSPPTRRIWRARWRRRWFTLKQGEIPEQFCLEYYTDRNCRKLKGVIDLDQCEQVDCGLRLENRKQKFQFMFDIKTPKRTYYLAADTESDMRDWVNCICQVCHLHDTKQSSEVEDNFIQSTTSTMTSPEFNSVASIITNSEEISQQPLISDNSSNPENSSNNDAINQHTQGCNKKACQNNCFPSNIEMSHQQSVNDSHLDQQNVSNPNKNSQQQSAQQQNVALYLNSALFQTEIKKSDENESQLSANTNSVMRKIPENLVLDNVSLSDVQQSNAQQSHSVSSGPYIPISECFSGSPKFILDNNSTTMRLNNLDPKFYDTPRSRENIGLNLTNDQSYSPKITNCNLPQILTSKNRNHKSDSDSESVFTDDDDWTNPLPLRETDRSTRPSDSSVENESYVLTYSQRFSKLPDDAQKNGENTPNSAEKKDKVLKNKNNLILDNKENSKIMRDLPQLSDTENTSPAIRPHGGSSIVEENYDIPRSHNLPYYNMTQLFDKVLSPIAQNPIALSTPNLMATTESGSISPNNMRKVSRSHYYTNAAPKQVEENVFRYDFDEQGNLPPVNRSLKPKVNLEDKPPEDIPAKPPTKVTSAVTAIPIQRNTFQCVDNSAIKSMPNNKKKLGASTIASDNIVSNPPMINRTLKPTVYRIAKPSKVYSTSSARSSTVFLPSEDEGYIVETQTLPRQSRSNYTTATCMGGDSTYENTGLGIHHQRTASALAAIQTSHNAPIMPQKSIKNEHKLQYFDLDVANPPAIHRQSISVGNLKSTEVPAQAPANSSVVYNLVDFVKTEAFKRIREERKKKSDGLNSTN